jgi:hypothetical protein
VAQPNRTFDLFSSLDMEITDLKVNPNAPLGSIIPYYMQNVQGLDGFEPWCYNSISLWGSYASIEANWPGGDPFHMSTHGGIPLR